MVSTSPRGRPNVLATADSTTATNATPQLLGLLGLATRRSRGSSVGEGVREEMWAGTARSRRRGGRVIPRLRWFREVFRRVWTTGTNAGAGIRRRWPLSWAGSSFLLTRLRQGDATRRPMTSA